MTHSAVNFEFKEFQTIELLRKKINLVMKHLIIISDILSVYGCNLSNQQTKLLDQKRK